MLSTALIWYLVSVGHGVTYSPPMATQQECERILKAVYEASAAPYKTFYNHRCIQVVEVKK